MRRHTASTPVRPPRTEIRSPATGAVACARPSSNGSGRTSSRNTVRRNVGHHPAARTTCKLQRSRVRYWAACSGEMVTPPRFRTATSAPRALAHCFSQPPSSATGHNTFPPSQEGWRDRYWSSAIGVIHRLPRKWRVTVGQSSRPGQWLVVGCGERG